METLQKRFLDVLDTRASARGLDLVVSYEFSNRGVLNLMRPNSFDTRLSIPFDVQTNRVTLGWMSPHEEGAQDVFSARPNPKFAGFEAGELDEAIASLLTAAGGTP
jgi:hypothetical protein